MAHKEMRRWAFLFWVCFSNPSSSLFEAIVVSLRARLYPLISSSFQINRTGILGLRMCAGEPLFSLTPICHFLPEHPIPPQNAVSCPSLVASDVPPSPSEMVQDFTLSLSNIQEVRQTTSSYGSRTWPVSNMHVVKMIGITQTHTVCLLQAEFKHRWIFVRLLFSVNEKTELE